MTGINAKDMLARVITNTAFPSTATEDPSSYSALNPDRETEKRYTAMQRVGDTLFGESFTPNLPPGDVHLSATSSVLRGKDGEVVAAIQCIRDNTERKRLEERLNRAEKMESLGTLAGG